MQTDAGRPAEPAGERHTSDILQALFTGDPDERITFAAIVDALQDRAFGLVILVFALPNMVPGPPIPGLSAITGLPIVLLAAQFALGRREPWLPGFVTRRSLRRGDFARMVNAALPTLRRIEKLFRPRFSLLTSRRADLWVGAALVICAVVLLPPIPVVNMALAWGIGIAALGLIESDGLAILAGLVIGALCIAWVAAIFLLGLAALDAWFPWLPW